MLLIILCAMCSIITLAFRDWEGGGEGRGGSSLDLVKEKVCLILISLHSRTVAFLMRLPNDCYCPTISVV